MHTLVSSTSPFEFLVEDGQDGAVKRCGGEHRGNSRDRRNRRQWIFDTFGNGTTCNCVHCDATLDNEWDIWTRMEVDRIVPGGSYARHNIQPACRKCNRARGDNPNWTSPNRK